MELTDAVSNLRRYFNTLPQIVTSYKALFSPYYLYFLTTLSPFVRYFPVWISGTIHIYDTALTETGIFSIH